jgi:DNA-directed RNA polymerase sigma subunit (sigma70/sigma32)
MMSRTPERDNLMKELRKQGKTLDEIGKIFSVRRQRVFQIVGRLDKTLDKNNGQSIIESKESNQ